MFIGMPMMMHSDTPESGRQEVLSPNIQSILVNLIKKMKHEFTANRVFLSEVGGVKEMIGCFLEGGQHEHTLLHFG